MIMAGLLSDEPVGDLVDGKADGQDARADHPGEGKPGRHPHHSLAVSVLIAFTRISLSDGCHGGPSRGRGVGVARVGPLRRTIDRLANVCLWPLTKIA